jgi:Ser/Thr protein kinase RdoA (MazF antagonist)
MEPIPFRATTSDQLLALVGERYGVDVTGELRDAGGINLNLVLGEQTDAQRRVLRVYAPWVSERRVRFIQHARAALRDAGLPFTETVKTTDGETLVEVDGRVAEMELYVEGTRMDQRTQLEVAMTLLGRIHTEMARLDLAALASDDEVDARYPNHIHAGDALDAATRVSELVHSWPDPTDDEMATAASMVELAQALAPIEGALAPHQRMQLVHGDYWDNNVLFDDDGTIVAVLDLDFCGWRPRIDDVALTFYYTTSEHRTDALPPEHFEHLSRALDAYDDALDEKLSADERTAVPLATARTVLFMTRHMLAVDETDRQRNMLRGVALDVRWSLAQATALT